MNISSAFRDGRIRDLILPARVALSIGPVSNPEHLAGHWARQSSVRAAAGTRFGAGGAVVLDFGRELAGGVRLVTGRFDKDAPKLRRVRIRFGESLSEASDSPCYGHSVMDCEVLLTTLAAQEFGSTGFRFVRLDFLDETELIGVQAVHLHREFECNEFHTSDVRIDEIWRTGAETLALCCQDFVWDGLKRDRLVWMGDLGVELAGANACFGRRDIFASSMDFLRDETPLPGMMNGSLSYSLYWIAAQGLWFRLYGDMNYLGEQKRYLSELCKQLLGMIDPAGNVTFRGGWLLLDWATGCDASKETESSIVSGNRALLKIALDAAAILLAALGETVSAARCRDAAERLSRRVPPLTSSKSNAALQVLAGLRAPEEAADFLAGGCGEGFSTFHGGFMLEALARAGRFDDALAIVRRYWGGMLDLGATTFWEHFDVAWLENGSRIDREPAAGEIDVHRARGEGCFAGFRHSLCHGWGASVNAYLSERVAGIRQVAPDEIILEPHLSDLEYVSGSYRTEAGVLEYDLREGKILYKAPAELSITVRK